MITNFLQSLKIKSLSKQLSRNGLAEALNPARISPAPETFSSRLQNYLNKADNLPLQVFLTEFNYWCLDSTFPYPREPVTSVISKQTAVYCAIFRKALQNNSHNYAEAYKTFWRRMDMLADSRLQASEIETLLTAESKEYNPNILPYEVDWAQTDKQNLTLILPPTICFASDNLPSDLQAKIAALWGEILFLSSKLLFGWQDIIYNQKGEVNFYLPDYMLPIDSQLKNFAVKYLKTRAIPQKYAEYKFVAAFTRLKKLCPKVDFFDCWQSFINTDYHETYETQPNSEYLKNLQDSGLTAVIDTPLKLNSLKKIKALQTPKNITSGKRFLNSSPIVIIIISMAIYFLLKHF